MKSLSLILRILAILAAAASIGLFLTTKGKLADKDAELQMAQTATQSLQSELDTSSGQVTTLQAQLSTERKSLADSKGQLESIRSEMYTSKQEVTRTQQQLKQAKDSISELENTATSLRSKLVKTEEDLAASSKEAELAQLNERVTELTAANESLSRKVRDAQNQANQIKAMSADNNSTQGAAPAGSAGYVSTFKPNTTPAAKAASIGEDTTIASISTKDGIVILSNSAKLGLVNGASITLIHDLKALGQVKIIKINDQFAIANILPGTNLKGLDDGDTVTILH